MNNRLNDILEEIRELEHSVQEEMKRREEELKYKVTKGKVIFEKEIAEILKEYGEERFAPSIARHLVGARKIKKIQTTFELVEVIKKSMPFRFQRGKIHPATRTFQALRIAVNDELGNLKKLLADGFEVLSDGGRFAIVSFHSLEDRIVKNFFREKKAEGQGEILTKKPITPGEAEISENPRSRSAKLRVVEKIS